MRLLIAIGMSMEFCYVSFYAVDGNKTGLFIIVYAAAFCLFSALALGVRRNFWKGQPPSRMLMVIFGFAVVFRLTLLFDDPVASDDIYRYLWDGKVSAAGLNPFSLPPSDPSFIGLHTEELPSKVSFPDMRTIYPPLAQAFFWFSNALFGDSVAGMKLILLIADLLTIIILLKLVRLQDSRPETVILYAWSPLPIMYAALDGHLEPLAILFLVLFLFLATSSRPLLASIALGLGGLVKFFPLFVAPLLLRLVKGWKGWGLLGVVVTLMVGGALLYYEPTGGLVDALGVYSSSFEFNGSLFTILLYLLGSNLNAHIVNAALFLGWLIVVFILNRSLVEKVFMTFVGFVVLSPVVHPWYLSWLAALLVVRWSLPVFVLLGLSDLSNIVVYRYHATGVWRDDPLLLAFEYVPVLFVFVWQRVGGTERFSKVFVKLRWTP